MRIIPRIEIKNNFVIKGINFEGLRKIGDPNILGKNIIWMEQMNCFLWMWLRVYMVEIIYLKL